MLLRFRTARSRDPAAARAVAEKAVELSNQTGSDPFE